MKKRSGFKLGGMSFGAGTGAKAASMMEEQGIMPKQGSGFMKKDPKIKKQLLDQLSKMKDPMNSNRGKAIANKLMKDFGMSGDELDSFV